MAAEGTRKVLAWRVSNTLDAEFCIEALEEAPEAALARFGGPEIFNTDQGGQFTSPRFTGVLQRAGARYETRPCLDEPPTPAELHDVLARLGSEPWEIAREHESEVGRFADLPRDAAHREDWVAALVAHPRAIQRPIILLDDGTFHRANFNFVK